MIANRQTQAQSVEIKGPIIHLAQGVAQVFLLVSAWRSYHIHIQFINLVSIVVTDGGT